MIFFSTSDQSSDPINKAKGQLIVVQLIVLKARDVAIGEKLLHYGYSAREKRRGLIRSYKLLYIYVNINPLLRSNDLPFLSISLSLPLSLVLALPGQLFVLSTFVQRPTTALQVYALVCMHEPGRVWLRYISTSYHGVTNRRRLPSSSCSIS